MTRRDFLKTLGVCGAGLAVSTVTPATPAGATAEREQGSDPLYRPLYGYIVEESGNTPLRNISSYGLLPRVMVPYVHKPGTFVEPFIAANSYAGAGAFRREDYPVVPLPNKFHNPKLATGISTVPYQPDIAWDQWKAYADAPDIDPNLTKLKFLGDWHLGADQVNIAAVGQIPDSPANWRQWRDLETARELGNINDERFDNPVPLYLKTGTDLLWSFPDKDIGQSTVLADICPAVAAIPEYEVMMRTVFPVIDETGPIPVVQIWCHIVHSDPIVKATCGDNVEVYQFIEMDTLLIRVPPAIRRDAERRVEGSTRIWPMQLEFEPVFGGIPREGLARAAMFTIGALVIIGIVILVVANPQFLILAAVAI